MTETASFDIVRRRPAPPLDAYVVDICGYRETSRGLLRQVETANLVIPLIVSFGSPFRIALGRLPHEGDRQPSFTAGLFPGPVHIESDGGAECVQMDFTPLGAFRLFGGAVPHLAARMVDIEDVLGHDGRLLRQRLGETQSWRRRMDLVEAFVAERAIHDPSPEIAFAWRELARSGGTGRISDLATAIGWSRKHLARRFSAEIGLAPKIVARMFRFRNACRLACAGHAGWSGIAAQAGYADQAHLVREFGELAGESPAAWADRVEKMSPEIVARMDYLQDG